MRDARVKGGVFHQPFGPYDDRYVKSHYSQIEPDTGRRFQLDNLTAPGSGLRGHPKYEFLGVERFWRYAKDKMQRLYEQGRVIQTAPGRVPRYKRYLDEMPGVAIGDTWEDIAPLNSQAKERLGYPTQKPVALLERIIEASSNPGDLVLDPFCGCGTTIDAARRLNRQWAGIDIDAFAIDLIRERLEDANIPAYGMPYDLAGAVKLAAERPFAFETWAVRRLTGFVPNTNQVADGGVDGRGTVWDQPEGNVTKLALAQVKGGAFSLSTLRDFGRVIHRDRAAVGCYVTLEPADTPAARAESGDMGGVQIAGMRYPRLQRWSIADYFDERPPRLPIMANPYTGKPMQARLI